MRMMEIENKPLTLNKNKRMYIKQILFALFLIGVGIFFLGISFDFNNSGMYGGIGGIIGSTIGQLSRRAKFKKENKVVIKYFNLNIELFYILFIPIVIGIMIFTFKSTAFILLAILMIILGLYIVIEDLIRYIKKIPLAVINEDGIKINLFFLKMHKVQWRDIKNIFKYSECGKESIGIELYDMKDFRSKMNIFERLSMKNNKVLGINQERISMQINVLYNMLEDIVNENS